jgi:BirA family biotin operon repressor/biotin-[acetyl-CoA-carboxylase] ligase
LEAGFDIEEKPGFGLRLLGSPDRLIADEIRSFLLETRIAREVIVLDETDSTNQVALNLARQGHPGGVVVIAERQNAGRGRFGRRWESPKGKGLWFSVLLAVPPSAIPLLARHTTWAGVSVACAVENHLGLRTLLKWPNDVEVAGRKVAGILIESVIGTTTAVVTGIGINVNQTTDDFPEELRSRAGALAWSVGKPLDRTTLLVAVLRELERNHSVMLESFERLVAAAEARSALMRRRITVQVAGDAVSGYARGLDPEGNLILQTDSRITVTLNAGEVTLRGDFEN